MDRKATGLPLVEGTRNIVTAMQRHGVRRYIGNGTTPSVLDPHETGTWQTRQPTFMAKTFLRRAYDELIGKCLPAAEVRPEDPLWDRESSFAAGLSRRRWPVPRRNSMDCGLSVLSSPAAEHCGSVQSVGRDRFGRFGGIMSSGMARSMNLSKCGTVNAA